MSLVATLISFGILILIFWSIFRSKTGKPMACLKCGMVGPTKIETRGYFMVELVLWLCFLLPGLIYSVWRVSSRRIVCPSCGSAELVPPDSPAAKKMLRDLGANGL